MQPRRGWLIPMHSGINIDESFYPQKRNSATWASFGSIPQHIWGRTSKTKRETSVSKATIMGLLTCPFYPIGIRLGSDGGTMNLPKIHQLRSLNITAWLQ